MVEEYRDGQTDIKNRWGLKDKIAVNQRKPKGKMCNKLGNKQEKNEVDKIKGNKKDAQNKITVNKNTDNCSKLI